MPVEPEEISIVISEDMATAIPDVFETETHVFIRADAFKYHVVLPVGALAYDAHAHARKVQQWLSQRGSRASESRALHYDDETHLFTNDAYIAGVARALIDGGTEGVDRYMSLIDARERHPSTSEAT